MYSIAEWSQRYEVSIKGEAAKEGQPLRLGPLEYIRLKVYGHRQGTGFRRLKERAGAKTYEVFGIFCKLLEIAGNQRRGLRGQLLNENDGPATCDDLAFILDCPANQIQHALQVLLGLGWVKEESTKEEQLNSTQLNSTQENGIFPKIPESSGRICLNGEPLRLAELLLSLIRARKPDFKEPDMQRWAHHIDLMLRLDRRTPEQVERVIRWCQADVGDGEKWAGWQNNILSTAKLREKFDKLELKANAKPSRNRELIFEVDRHSEVIE